MKLFVGLGNPGARYAHNRHNIGFMAINAIAKPLASATFRNRFQGEAAEISLSGDKIILLKPMTYMNESGRAVGEAMRFYKLNIDQLYVFHDELDLPPAKLRVKAGGGNAGHNGLRSISAHCGNDYHRIRLGIGHPGSKEMVHPYVLSDFAKNEWPWVEDLCDALADAAPLLAKGEDASFQNRIHLAMQARGHASGKE